MKKLLYLSCMLVVCQPALATDNLPIFEEVPLPVSFDEDKSLTIQEQKTPTVELSGERQVSPTFVMPDISKLSVEELQEVNLVYAEELISMAIAGQHWDILQELLDIYTTMPAFDGILSEYAKGAMLRKQGNQAGAIAKYKSILASRPELSYVKLDLALMLAEDKQFKEADKLLAELQTANITPTVLAVVQRVRADIKEYGRWKPSLTFNYESTDNVNNASPDKVITWLGRQWQKSDSSLPQSAHGVRYGVGVNKTTNITGNHNAVIEGDVSGVYYWDNKDYNERSVRLAGGYYYANIKRNWRIMPFFEQNWLDNDKYNQQTGMSLGYNQGVGKNSRIQLGATFTHKSYDNAQLAKRYDGNMTSLTSTITHKLDNNTLIYGGIDGSFDDTEDKELASTRYGIRGGVIQEFDGGLGLNASVRYAKRDFDAPSTLVYQFTRQDNEYQAALSAWHKKLAWYGLRPQFNIRYIKINSNMPAFYSRDGLSYFMSIEKSF